MAHGPVVTDGIDVLDLKQERIVAGGRVFKDCDVLGIARIDDGRIRPILRRGRLFGVDNAIAQLRGICWKIGIAVFDDGPLANARRGIKPIVFLRDLRGIITGNRRGHAGCGVGVVEVGRRLPSIARKGGAARIGFTQRQGFFLRARSHGPKQRSKEAGGRKTQNEPGKSPAPHRPCVLTKNP